MALTGKGRLPLKSSWCRDVRSLYQPIIPGSTNIVALATTSFALGRNTNVNIKWWSGDAWVYPPFLQKFLLNEAPGLESYSGIAFKATIQAGAAFGDVLYLDGTTFKKASATNISTCPVKAICIDDTTVMRCGFINGSRWSFTAGQTLYTSTSAGDMTATAPSATNNVVQILGWAASATVLYFDPDQTYLELL